MCINELDIYVFYHNVVKLGAISTYVFRLSFKESVGVSIVDYMYSGNVMCTASNQSLNGMCSTMSLDNAFFIQFLTLLESM